jgi:hypothetical protein
MEPLPFATLARSVDGLALAPLSWPGRHLEAIGAPIARFMAHRSGVFLRLVRPPSTVWAEHSHRQADATNEKTAALHN